MKHAEEHTHTLSPHTQKHTDAITHTKTNNVRKSYINILYKKAYIDFQTQIFEVSDTLCKITYVQIFYNKIGVTNVKQNIGI